MARKVLLADDSVTAQNMGRRILADAGYEVTTVNNGSAALKKVADSRPDMIVLDVYMPGYGGLEVCQRLRESDDTARIPVLLTVGKLEPFKVEDVRRVRADAFIVKPFDASELLTALTKLEDRIVPQPQQRKGGGRMPKPGGGLDDLLTREYGNTETGWKSRLSIPPPHLKSKPEVEEPEPQQSSEKAQEATQAKIEAVLAKESLATAAGLPADITADEIAAIQAAAASFTLPPELAAKLMAGGSETAPATAETKPETEEAKAETKTETPAIETNPTSEAQPTISSSSPVETAAASTEIPASETKITEPAPTVGESAPDATVAVGGPAEQTAAPATEKLAEHEVAAVLASLQAVTGADAVDRSDEPLFATIAAATPREPVTGPRWMAASVPLTEDERALILEEEMQKALAAMAAIQATEAAAAYAQVPTTIPATVETWSTPVVGESTEVKNEAPQEPAQPVEAVASESVPQPAVVEEQAAYAAAAAAGAAPGATTSSVEVPAPVSPPETAPTVAEPADPQRESELAAAWASWKQVRDSVVSPQLASQVAESIAASASASESAVSDQTQASSPAEQETAESASAEPASEGPDESAAIAGIVDTVLAELKPKLMQEIAKKMNKPKKQKK